MKSIPRPKAFPAPKDFRAWLEKHHRRAKELVVRCYKTHAKDKGVTYPEAVDEALCFGWIDGVRRGFDEDSFTTRFSPRKPKSKWSAINIRRVGALKAAGRMRPPGLAVFRARDKASSGYSYESRPVDLDPAVVKKLRANRRAWSFFQAQPPWYRRTSAFWVMSAKREETRARRLGVLISSSERERTIPLLTRTPGKGPAKRRTQ